MNASWAAIEYFGSIFIVMFTYTFLWDLYVGFWNMALAAGANSTVMMYFYTIHVYIPVIFLIGSSITFLVRVQRKVPQYG